MNRFVTTAILLAVVVAHAPCVSAAIPTTERDALIALYNATNGAGWINRPNWRNAGDTDFNDPGTECTWWGVVCNPAGTAVEVLAFLANNLTGTIPAEIGNLTHLENITMAENNLRGQIPAEIGSLTNLEALFLNGNRLDTLLPVELQDLEVFLQSLPKRAS